MLKLFVIITCLVLSDVLGSHEYIYNKLMTGSFKRHQVPATWQEAFLTCNEEGAVLASPLDADMEYVLRLYMFYHKVDRPIYLGTNALQSKGLYVSLEGVQLDSMPVELGSYGDGKQPGDCLTLSPDGKVYTASCLQYLPYYCYKHGEPNSKLDRCGDESYTFNAETSSCYKLHKEEKKWSEAYKTCLNEGGYLVVLNDRQEAEAIVDLFPKADAAEFNKTTWDPLTHVGLLDWNRDFTWITVKGEKLENVYNKWAPGQPDGRGDYTCTTLLRDGNLDNFSCSEVDLMFVCEKEGNAKLKHSAV